MGRRGPSAGSGERALDRVLLLDGEAGIGKTHLWRAASRAARARGYRVLACAPAEAEAGLAYAGLHDLLRGIPETLYAELPEPRMRALGVALYRGPG